MGCWFWYNISGTNVKWYNEMDHYFIQYNQQIAQQVAQADKVVEIQQRANAVKKRIEDEKLFQGYFDLFEQAKIACDKANAEKQERGMESSSDEENSVSEPHSADYVP